MSFLWSSLFPSQYLELYDLAYFSYGILPPELWRIILDFILDEIRHPYLYCTPASFPQLQARLYYADMLEEDSKIDDSKRIRSVCRMWWELAGPRPHRRLSHLPSFNSKERSMLKGTSSILFCTPFDEKTLFGRIAHDSTFSRNLTTIIFGEDHPYEWVDLLFAEPLSFPNLRCLSLLSVRSSLPFWEIIQTGFPQLTVLTLRSIVPDQPKRYTLKNLEVLDVATMKHLRLSCPSLKHLSIRHGDTSAITDFLVEHSQQLESLSLQGTALSTLIAQTDSLWSIFPNIRMLGKQATISLPTPPLGHPLRHLRLFSRCGSLDAETIISELNSFPNVTHLHIQSDDLESGTMARLRAQCHDRAVGVVNVPCMRPVPTSRVASFITMAVFSITCPFWAPGLICCWPAKACVLSSDGEDSLYE
ncbi:hypothetical protein FRB91_002337 [Serendipita sp. 411]|nr:hypothetical protein FRB91_002337 [Serendipita sp. 411]